MKKDFELDVVWIPHEIHPETPVSGISITDRFSQFDVDQVMEACRQKAEPYGLKFGDLKWLSNSRMSLEAAEYARDKGVYDVFHHVIFEAYFSEGKDIGDKNVLMECASRVGLDVEELRAALEEGRYGPRVAEGSREARRLGVTAVPSFFIEDLPAITGAVAEERFREALESVAGRKKLF